MSQVTVALTDQEVVALLTLILHDDPNEDGSPFPGPDESGRLTVKLAEAIGEDPRPWMGFGPEVCTEPWDAVKAKFGGGR